MIRVELFRAWPHRYESTTVELDDGAQVGDALDAAGWRLDAGFVGLAVFGVAATQAVNPALFADLPYDPEKDFAAVALLGVTGFVVVVPAASGITDLAGLLARLRAEPGRHNFGSAGVGSMPHLAGEWFAKGTGVQVEHVAYRGGGPAMQALLSGEVTFMIESVPTVAGAIADGRLRAIARASQRAAGPQAGLPTRSTTSMAWLARLMKLVSKRLSGSTPSRTPRSAA